MFGRFTRFDRAGHLDGAAEKQQFFRKRRFSRIRMADDPEGAPSFNFFLQLLAQNNSNKIKKAGICPTFTFLLANISQTVNRQENKAWGLSQCLIHPYDRLSLKIP